MAEKRVGTLTMGLSLVLFGVLFALHTFFDIFTFAFIIKLWPIVIIFLGIEMLVNSIKDKDSHIKVDFLSFLLTFAVLAASMCMAGAEFMIEHC